MITLLLTGCIHPNGMSLTSLQNPEVRRLQYIDSIRFYLKKTPFNIVFVENSGTDISTFFNDLEIRRIDFVTFVGNDYNKLYGKGYGEMLILKEAFKRSKFISETTRICKITGRYKIANIMSLISSSHKMNSSISGLFRSDFQFMDSRIFIADWNFYSNYLFANSEVVNDSEGMYFEKVLSKSVLRAMADNIIYAPFKVLPRIIGQSGTDGMYYRSSLFYWLPRSIVQYVRFYLIKIDL